MSFAELDGTTRPFAHQGSERGQIPKSALAIVKATIFALLFDSTFNSAVYAHPPTFSHASWAVEPGKTGFLEARECRTTAKISSSNSMGYFDQEKVNLTSPLMVAFIAYTVLVENRRTAHYVISWLYLIEHKTCLIECYCYHPSFLTQGVWRNNTKSTSFQTNLHKV